MTETREPKILALLQNTWVNDVERCEESLERHASAPVGGRSPLEMRRYLTTAWLFMGCMTGQRLKRAFGADGVYEITWDNASPRLAGRSSGAFPPDPEHIRAVLDDVNPDIVLAFGRVAQRGLEGLWDGPLLVGPHPTARGAEVQKLLAAMARELEVFKQEFAKAVPA